MKLFLDDKRPTPQGWVRVRTVSTCLELLKWNWDSIKAVSLDNDLGKGYTEGYKVARWLEEKVINGVFYAHEFPILNCHSSNPVGRKDMETAFKNIKKHLV
jgi:hypothetical protein